MRLTHLAIAGLRSFEAFEQPLAPVTVFCGSNGSGKTTAIGGVIYGLTGRFPGITGANADDLAPLMRALPPNEEGAARRRAKPYFSVTLRGSTRVGDHDVEVAVQRGLTITDGAAKHKLEVRIEGPAGRVGTSGKAAERELVPLFGDVQWMADLFDPRRSFWTESPERRMAWAFGLCAESAGAEWTREGVELRVTEGASIDREDFDRTLGDTVAQMLDLNVTRLHQRVLAAQKLAREARRVADAITAPTFPPTDDEVQQADRAVREAHERYATAKAALSDATARQQTYRAAQQDVARLERQLEEARRASAGATPPQPPQAPVIDQPTIERLLREVESIDFDLAEGDGQEEDPRLTALEGVASEARALLRRVGDSRSWTIDLAAAVERLDLLPPPASPLARRRAIEEQIDALRAPAARHRMAMDEYEAAVAEFTRQVRTAGESADRIARDLARAREIVASGEPPRSDVDLDPARATLESAERRQQELRAIATLAHEQVEQIRAAERAEARADSLKSLHQRAVDAQEAMMAAGLSPLSEALARIRVPAARDSSWVVSPAHLLAMKTPTATLPFGVLSEGERFRGSIALLLATAAVRRQSWRALFLDGLERVSSDVRSAVVEALVIAVRDGLLDNAFVGCATTVAPQPGALVMSLG